ncbi:MAG: polysaccharide deacetylase [Ferruginibacter sp.]|nr:polysaccharide deacetylase [Ferruginibacter sp.]
MLFFSKHESAIFLFHRVLPERDPMWDPTDPALFERSLKYISKNFHPVSLDEVIANKSAYRSKPLAAITFDDGYRDFIDYSLPILQRQKLTASMFIVTDCIEKNIPVWTYIFDQLFFQTNQLVLTGINEQGVTDASSRVIWAHKSARMAFGKKLKQAIKYIPSAQRDAVIREVNRNFKDVVLPANLMMSWQDIKDIHAAGIQVGAHSVTHPTLDTIEAEETLYAELKESKDSILDNSGIVADIFSYPNGSYNQQVIEQTKKAGYRAALAVHKKPFHHLKDDPYAISRIELYNESWMKTKASLNGMTSFAKKMLGR